MYAGGKIPGSFFRREGRASTEAILVSRLTDRPLRPLFAHGMQNEVQVIMYSFSADGVNPLDILAINAASAAIMISDIPWNGPVGAVRVGRVNGEFVINPTFAEIDDADPPVFESEAAYLRRHRLLTPAERVHLKAHPELLVPEVVVFDDGDADAD